MVDGDLPPGDAPGKMTLSHKFPRCGVGVRDRVLAVLDAGCPCGSATATMRRRFLRGQTEIVTVHLQCDTCGRSMAGSLPRREFPFFQDFPEWDESLRIAFAAGEKESWQRYSETRREAWKERQASYADWLRSCPGWHQLRSKVLARAGGVCEACLKAPAEHVHHVGYDRGKLPPAWDLRAVCAECHRLLHDGWTHNRLDAAE